MLTIGSDIVLTQSRPLIIHFRLTEPGKIPHRLCRNTETPARFKKMRHLVASTCPNLVLPNCTTCLLSVQLETQHAVQYWAQQHQSQSMTLKQTHFTHSMMQRLQFKSSFVGCDHLEEDYTISPLTWVVQ